MNDLQVIGCGVTGAGAVFLLLGVLSLLNRRFLVTANALLLLGVPMMMGIHEFRRFVFQKEKMRGTLAFLLGLMLVLLRLSLPGIVCEVVGCYWLFGGFLPIFFSLMSRIPIIGGLVPSSLKKEDLDL